MLLRRVSHEMKSSCFPLEYVLMEMNHVGTFLPTPIQWRADDYHNSWNDLSIPTVHVMGCRSMGVVSFSTFIIQ